LQKRLWPDTFVDVEHNLNTIINKIREALGDSADTARLVETLPRRGYRFIGRIESEEPEPPPIEPEPRKPFWIRKSALIALAQSLLIPKNLIASAALFLLLTLSGSFLKWQLARSSGDPGTIRSIAVLPLANLSDDPNQQYLVDGMTEELTSEIRQLHSLRVVSRTSTMQYRDTHKKAPQIAKELHAGGLIAGSILQVKDRVRVTVQLIHGPSDAQVWSKSYERDLRDVIAMQHGIASDIAREVRISLGPQEQAHLGRAREVMPEVHEAYLLHARLLPLLNAEVQTAPHEEHEKRPRPNCNQSVPGYVLERFQNEAGCAGYRNRCDHRHCGCFQFKSDP
jgi:TolB-like protein